MYGDASWLIGTAVACLLLVVIAVFAGRFAANLFIDVSRDERPLAPPERVGERR